MGVKCYEQGDISVIFRVSGRILSNGWSFGLEKLRARLTDGLKMIAKATMISVSVSIETQTSMRRTKMPVSMRRAEL
jgi:hypothetical protein